MTSTRSWHLQTWNMNRVYHKNESGELVIPENMYIINPHKVTFDCLYYELSDNNVD